MNKQRGLTSSDVGTLLEKYGRNVLPESPPTSDLILFLRQVQSPLIYILLIAAGLSWYLSDITDAIVILLAVVVNTVLGFYQERKAERGLLALKKILTPRARVLRNGHIEDVDATGIVPGDLVIVAAGDKVSADGYLIEAAGVTVNEAILTGESIPVIKSQISNPKSQNELEKIEQSSQVFMGTTVVAGVGRILVTKTGLATQMGNIAQSLSQTEDEATPLQKRFTTLARMLTIMVVVAAVFIFAIGYFRGESLVEIFATSVAVAVAAIPEGLVVALTAILAIGMQRILKRKALVRKLVVAETLGTVTVIATDKTGTLTQGKLQVTKTDFLNKEEAMLAAVYANQLLDPLELALWEWLKAQPKFDPEEALKRFERRELLPFDSNRKYSATLFDHATYILGAPETLINQSSLSKTKKQEYFQKIETWAREGLRVLALAKKIIPKNGQQEFLQKPELINCEFLGLVGFTDPVREGVKNALTLCQQAGISVKVVTGDYRWTAEAVMRLVGLTITDPGKQIIEGEELAHLSDEALQLRVQQTLLFARVSPDEKLKIVTALKKNGEVVALLGDGVNDAPALKRADIGIVVNDASDVARETADLVLLDSNFATIVAAVEEGRGIFANIQKVLMYLLGDTFAEVILIFLGLLFGVPLPLTAAQILWINLVTDTLPTLALTVEPKEAHLLKRKPIAADLPLLSKSVVGFMLVISAASGLVVFGLFLYIWKVTGDVHLARVVAFTAFSIKSLAYVFSVRHRNHFIWQRSLFDNPWLWIAVGIGIVLQLIGLYVGPIQAILHTQSLSAQHWLLIFLSAAVITVVIECAKFLRLHFFHQQI